MKHVDTAERLQFFLATRGMSRDRFLQEIGGAITRSSLASLLNGHRRPARTLAVLMEWKWGFRADYLLHGKGEPWKAAGTRIGGLAPVEADVVNFMRQSPAAAVEMQTALEQAMLWQALFQRTERSLAGLSEAASDPRMEPVYPRLASATLEECQWLAEAFRLQVAWRHHRRVLRLTRRFLTRFVAGAPIESVRREPLAAALRPVIASLERAEREAERQSNDSRERLLAATRSTDPLAEWVNLTAPHNARRALLEALQAVAPELVDAGFPVAQWQAWAALGAESPNEWTAWPVMLRGLCERLIAEAPARLAGSAEDAARRGLHAAPCQVEASDDSRST